METGLKSGKKKKKLETGVICKILKLKETLNNWG